MRIAVSLEGRTGGVADGFIGFFSDSVAASNGPADRLAGRSAGFRPGKRPGVGRGADGWFVACSAAVGNPPIALVLWDGEAIGHAAPKARLKIHDRRTFWQLLANVYLTFGDALQRRPYRG